jgi:hypothetical protein
VAALGGCLILPAFAAAANPAPGAHFIVHHDGRGAGWHVELRMSRSEPGIVRTVLVADERCGETVEADSVRLQPDGSLDAGADFTATDRRGHAHNGSWSLHARFPLANRVVGAFRVTEPGCGSALDFAGNASGTPHHHGAADPFDYADIARATRAARTSARRMLERVRAVAARRFPTIARARAQGFSRYMARHKIPEPGVFHLWSRQYNGDGVVLDPEHPESLVYWKPSRPGAEPSLVAFMFRFRPSAHPDFAGTIPSYHSHKRGGDRMTHVWLVRGLRGAYANCLPVPELERSVHAFDFEQIVYDGLESQACTQDSRPA